VGSYKRNITGATKTKTFASGDSGCYPLGSTLGGQWRNLPDSFSKWQLVYYYFRKWQQDGTMKRLNWQLNIKESMGKKRQICPVC